MRLNAASYARFSTDLQTDKSIDDQQRLCRGLAERNGWHIVAELSDHAISGASLIRPSIQRLLRMIENREIDIVIAEALDRLSRDQEHIAHIYKQCEFAGIKIFTYAEGEIDVLKKGVKGIMSELFLKDLAQKTHRGLEGVAKEGRSAGGRSYGYKAVNKLDDKGELIRGLRCIDPDESKIVIRIFKEYVAGASPKAIVKGLNTDGIPSPRGGEWGFSTINGNRKRGNGILNNELYIGRSVWNRQQFFKHPKTGTRNARVRKADDVTVVEVPELRIIDQELWDAAKRVQGRLDQKTQFWQKQRPKGLLSGLLRCGCCGGGYAKITLDRVGCTTRRDKGTCSNRRSMKITVLEERVLGALRERLMNDELCAIFCDEYYEHQKRVRLEHNAAMAGYQSEFERNKRQIDKLLDAIAQGLDPLTVKDRINSLSERQRDLEALIKLKDVAPVLLHPAIAHRYKVAVQKLIDLLSDTDHRSEAADLIRSLIEKIVLTPSREDEGLTVDLYGDLAGILQASVGGLPAQKEKTPGTRPGVISHTEEADKTNALSGAKMVAGIGFEPMTFRL